MKNRTRLLLKPKTPVILNGTFTSLEVMTVSNITLLSCTWVDPILTLSLSLSLSGDLQNLLSYCSGTSPAKLQIIETKLRNCAMLKSAVLGHRNKDSVSRAKTLM